MIQCNLMTVTDSKSNELSMESSQSPSVLFKSATGIVQNLKHTSMDVISTYL